MKISKFYLFSDIIRKKNIFLPQQLL